ncbi:hypothetical protein A4172_05485 [Streptococcus pneumoniae]|nr:hypothetical protein A4172_05485 [Streptococcus pneumoniae]
MGVKKSGGLFQLEPRNSRARKVRGTFSAWAKKFESEVSPMDFFSLGQVTRKLVSPIGFFNVNLNFILPKRY